MKPHVYPVFASPVTVFIVEDDYSDLVKLKKLSYTSSKEIGAEKSHTTSDKYVLNSLPEIKNIFSNYFSNFKNTILGLQTTDFIMTTSWGTKTDKNGFCQFHNHKNSVYSAVFYYDEINSGNLEFLSPILNLESVQLNESSSDNFLFSKSFYVEPQKGLLVFFPSYLMHRITKNNSKNSRYSLAMNFFPTGEIGSGDSSIKLNWS